MFAVVNELSTVASGTIVLTQNRLELIDGRLRRAPVATVAGGVPGQAMYGDSDVDFLTWTETPSTNLYDQPWTVLVHDRASGATRVLAQSAGGPVPAPPGGTVPFLPGGRGYWAAAQATGDPTRPARTFIESRDVQGTGPVRQEASDAMQPSAFGRFLFYVVSSLVNPARPPGQTAIHRRDLRTGRHVAIQRFVLAANQTLTGLASFDNSVAWIINTTPTGTAAGTAGMAELYLQDDDHPPTAVTGPGLTFADPVVTERFVGWVDSGENGSEWLFDRAKTQVVLLGQASGLAAMQGSGDRVLWRASHSQWSRGQLTP